MMKYLIIGLLSVCNCYSQTSEAYLKSGLNKEKRENYVGAIVAFSKAIELNPNDATAYNYRGFARSKIKDFRGSIVDFNKAIELNPKDKDSFFYRGISKITLHQKESGCLDLSKAGELGFDKAYDAIKDLCN